MRSTLTTGVALLAAALVCPAPASAQLPHAVIRGGVAFPKGDYDQTTEGEDMYAQIGWTAGAELRFAMTTNLDVFVSYDRISNPVDAGEVQAAIGTFNDVSSDNHVAQVTMAGFRLEAATTTNTAIALHGGFGMASFKPGDYTIANEGEMMWESDRRTTVAGGFSVTIYRFEAAFRYYPLGTFSNGGTVDTGDDQLEMQEVRAPVSVMTLTLGVLVP